MLAALAAGLGGAPARAETLPVEGLYAAGADAPSRARAITIAGFAGRGGERLAFAIDAALRAAIIAGRPYFALTFTEPPRGTAYAYDRDADRAAFDGSADAVLRGIAEVAVRDVDSGTKEGEECAARDAAGKCTEKKKVTYPCRARNVTLLPEVRLVSREGELLYARSEELTLSRRFCKDEETSPPVEPMVRELAEDFAELVRGDLAPTYRREEVRVFESRSGIRKADHAAFRAAIRLTKTDIGAACDGFAALGEANPDDLSLRFNIALCHESAGALDEAARAYEAVLALRPGKSEAEQGLARIASRQRARRQLALHGLGAEN